MQEVRTTNCILQNFPSNRYSLERVKWINDKLQEELGGVNEILGGRTAPPVATDD